jgi:ABC-type lipoprotein export system ATPase subunit
MVTHDEDLAKSVSRAVTIADGQIASDVRHTERAVHHPHAAHKAQRHAAEHPHIVLPSPLGFGAAAAD